MNLAARLHSVIERSANRTGETVLVVDDDPSMRRLMGEILTRCGFRVLQAPDTRSALAVSRGCPGTIDLLVTDVLMPGGRGDELVPQLAADQPGLRFLYISAYPRQNIVTSDAHTPFLEKPFTALVLEREVRHALRAIADK